MNHRYATIAEIREAHPFPWQQQQYGKGNLRLIDANNCEVDIFAMTALCIFASTAMQKAQVKSEAAAG